MSDKKIKFESLKIEKLKPAPYNPRVDLTEQDEEYQSLKRSIETFGFVEPIIFNKRTGYVVGGHQRLKVLFDLGYSEVLCAVVDLTEAEEKALNVALNKISGEWDFDKLKELLNDIQNEIDLSYTGFSNEEIDDLMRDYFDEGDINEEENFDAEAEAEAIIKPTSKKGDIYQLGPHRLIVGDATILEDITTLMDGKKADCIFSDPPYNVDYSSKNELLNKSDKGNRIQRAIENDKMENSAFLEFLLKSFSNWEKVMKQGAPFYICHADTEGLRFRLAVEQSGLDLKQVIIWVKNNIVIGRQDYQWKHEPILYGWKKGAPHKYYADRTKTTIFNSDKDLQKLTKKELITVINDFKNQLQTTIVREDKPMSSALHPTMKPLPLIRHFLMNSTRRGDIVLDSFLGSGSTLIACEQLNRVCYGVEFDPIYCDVIIKRYEEFTGNKAVKL